MTDLPEEVWIERERGYELREDEDVSEAVLVYVKKLKKHKVISCRRHSCRRHSCRRHH